MDVISTSMYPSQSVAETTLVSDAESRRLEAVRRYSVLDTPPEGAFDRVTRLAAQLFDVPIAIVSIVDHDRIFLKAVHGLEGVTQIPREPGLCSTAILGEGPYVVENALTDETARENALVTGPLGLRFYVGCPLTTSDGHNLGSLCVVDGVARRADPEKVEMLTALAKIVVDELELRLAARALAAESSRRAEAEASEALAHRRSQIDDLTGVQNRRAFERELDRRAVAVRGDRGALVMIDLDGMKSVNDRRGHDAGDRLLRAFAAALVCAFPDDDVYRVGGDEFVVVADRSDERTMRGSVDAAIRSVREEAFPEIRGSVGFAAFVEIARSPRAVVRLADSRMYAEKVSMR